MLWTNSNLAWQPVIGGLLLLLCGACSASRPESSPEQVDAGAHVRRSQEDAAAPGRLSPDAAKSEEWPDGFSVDIASDAYAVCPGACVQITASARGGVAPYEYTFDQGIGAGPGPHEVCPTETTRYRVAARDTPSSGEFSRRSDETTKSITIQFDSDCFDAGTVLADAGTALADAGTVLADAGTVLADAGTVLDAGAVDPADGGAPPRKPGTKLCGLKIASVASENTPGSYFGVHTSDLSSNLVSDPNGDLALALAFAGTLDLADGTSISREDGKGILVAKVSSDCRLLWARAIEGNDSAWSPMVAVGPEGGVVIAAKTRTLVPEGERVGTALYLGALSAQGELLWEKSFESAPGLHWQSVLRVDEQGDIVLLTAAAEGTDFGGGPRGRNTGPRTLDPTVEVLVKFAANGAHLWSKALQGVPMRASMAIVHGTGILFHGWSDRALNWGIFAGSTTGQDETSHGYIVHADGAGNYLSSAVVSEGDTEEYSWHWLEALPTHERLFSGFDMSGELALVSEDGEEVWAHQVVTSGIGDTWHKTVAGPSGDIFVGGDFRNPTTVNGELLTPLQERSSDAFVQKLSRDGALAWTYQSEDFEPGPNSSESLLGIASDERGHGFALVGATGFEGRGLHLVKLAP